MLTLNNEHLLISTPLVQGTNRATSELPALLEGQFTSDSPHRPGNERRVPIERSTSGDLVAVVDGHSEHCEKRIRQLFKRGCQIVIVKSDASRDVLVLEFFLSPDAKAQGENWDGGGQLANLLANCACSTTPDNDAALSHIMRAEVRALIKETCPIEMYGEFLKELSQARIPNRNLIVFPAGAPPIVAMLAAEIFPWTVCPEQNRIGQTVATYLFASKAVFVSQANAFSRFIEGLEKLVTPVPGEPPQILNIRLPEVGKDRSRPSMEPRARRTQPCSEPLLAASASRRCLAIPTPTLRASS